MKENVFKTLAELSENEFSKSSMQNLKGGQSEPPIITTNSSLFCGFKPQNKEIFCPGNICEPDPSNWGGCPGNTTLGGPGTCPLSD